MKPEWKKKWVEALRSGKYQQTRGELSAGLEGGGRCYCALGLLNQISGLGTYDDGSYVTRRPDWETTVLYLNDGAFVGVDWEGLESEGLIEWNGYYEEFHISSDVMKAQDIQDVPEKLRPYVVCEMSEEGLPPSVQELVGLQVDPRNIITLNDDERQTFEEIASWVEENL